MISLFVLFWLFLALFAIIGAMRRWSRELLVIPAVITALLLISLLENYIPYIRDGLSNTSTVWFRVAVLAVLSIMGYLAPNITRLINLRKFNRNRFDDALFGLILGAVNGYLIVGSAWYFLLEANYPFDWITAPEQVTAVGQNTTRLIEILPPQWLGAPMIYIAAVVSIVITLVVMI